jgi:hypothetical protein
MIYVVFILLAVLGGVGFGGYTYVSDLQERVEVLRENNAKLETALETSEASIDSLKEDMVKFAEANNRLQADLQQAEAYGDELRSKLRRHNLTALALRKPELIEGRMNGATANLWRELTEESGGDGSTPLPVWLQSPSVRGETGTGSEGGDQNREDDSSDSRQTETSKSS